jgi:ubiquinone/menaquinone biosynthesis C-methylase UbiE
LNGVSEFAPAVRAFDAVAPSFDARFKPWLSVAAQRRAVRRALVAAFPVGAKLIDIGGGTGEDAAWLAYRGREVLLTDAAPQMVEAARAKLGGGSAVLAPAECVDILVPQLGEGSLDGAYSNFAALNCVSDLDRFARGLARLLRPGASAMLVLFGTFCPAEMLVEALRGRRRNVFRRLTRGDAPARLGGEQFTVRYHRAAALRAAMGPWFHYRSRRAIGLAVPPSAAEPWISHHRLVLAALELIDRPLSRPLAMFGDHVLYRFQRTEAPADR